MKKKETQYRNVLVKSSFLPEKNQGGYEIFDIEENIAICHRIFKNVNTSSNVMAYLGIVTALKLSNGSVQTKVFCKNDVAVIWANNKASNSKIADKKLTTHITAANDYLRCNDCSNRIQLGVPRKLIPISEHYKNK